MGSTMGHVLTFSLFGSNSRGPRPTSGLNGPTPGELIRVEDKISYPSTSCDSVSPTPPVRSLSEDSEGPYWRSSSVQES